MTFLTSIFGTRHTRSIKGLLPIVAKINALEPEMKALSDSAFPEKTLEFKTRILGGATLDDILPEAFALVREASFRTLGQRHFDAQLIGGISLHNGKIAEMRTGEGKTLVATLPAYLNALTSKGVHVVTVNDYLSRRDGAWMGQIYAFLGLTLGVINSQNTSYLYDATHKEKDEERDEIGSFKVVYEFLRPSSRGDAYAADITYGTNNEFGFDYLRDNLVMAESQMVQRGHSYAIVDEVDSILIDEARTPLIISSELGDSESLYTSFATIAKKLILDEHYTVDEKLKAVSLTDEGINKAEEVLGITNIYTEKGIKYVHHLETAVRAEAIYIHDKDYVVKDGEIVIVDPFTGRLQPGRRWSEGLHQAIEAKEGVKIQKETRAVASITFQNYFRFYTKLSGMTGTAETSSEELYKVYGLDVLVIPTHRKAMRLDRNDLIFQTERGKFQAIAKKVKELNIKGQPVLIGTVSIQKNELLSAYLTSEGVPHEVLNAKNHEREGEIIAQSGKKGSVVIATNMAGRGVDISLGGKPASKEAYEEIKSLGGLFVLGTERHDARRIDNQLRGRAGRQGDPGETQFYVSLEDELMRVFGSDRIKNMMGKLGIPEDEAIENSLITNALETAQAKIEGFNFDARKHTLEYDNVLNYQRKIVYERRQGMLLGNKETLEVLLEDITNDNEEAKARVSEKQSKMPADAFWETLRRIALYVTDTLWVEHLETMDYLRSSVNLRAYGQREPLVEYKKEGLRLFKDMENHFREEVMSLIGNMAVDEAVEASTLKVEAQSPLVAKHTEIPVFGSVADEVNNTKQNHEPKPSVGRNDLCPCNSGKKYKKCHGN